ncbi:MAG: hypothetical protein ACO1SV_09070 [Fimbriimonas sp.]
MAGPMNPEELERFVRAFVVKEKRARWLSLFASAKGHKKLVRTFDHGYDFDSRWAEPPTHSLPGQASCDLRTRGRPAATPLSR